MIELVNEPKLDMPDGLRVADLIAKTARVTLRDTLRVIAALEAVSNLYQADAGEVTGECTFDAGRPGPEQVAACEREFYRMKHEAHPRRAEMDYALRLVASLQ